MSVSVFSTAAQLHKELSVDYEKQRLDRATDIVVRNSAALSSALEDLYSQRPQGAGVIFTVPTATNDEPSENNTTPQPLPEAKALEIDRVVFPPPVLESERSVIAPCWLIPSPPPLPPYKGWSHINQNVLAAVRPRRMFYVGASRG